jgi:hypothetical protein
MTARRRVKLDQRGLPVRKEDVRADDPDACQCAHLDREDWDGVESDWSDITFVKANTKAILGVPIGYDSVKAKLRAKAAKIGATVPEGAMQLNGSGKFLRPVLLEVEGAPAGSKDVVRPGGVAFTRIFEAPWGQLKKVARETSDDATKKYGRAPDKLWIWYLTCRICSRARNFETLIAAHYRHAP